MNKLPGIKNLIFDLGGVLLNIDFKKTFDAFAALGIVGAHEMHDRPDVLQLFLDLEVGAVDEAGFLERFRNLVHFEGGPRFHGDDSWRTDIVNAFNELLLDFPAERIRLVQELGKEYRTFLLSNTNEIHARCYNQRLKDNFGIQDLDHLMEKAFYSHELKCRKPDPQIYLKALELAGIKAEESIFFDDNEENVRVAEEVGIRGVLVSEAFTVNDFFKTKDLRPKT